MKMVQRTWSRVHGWSGPLVPAGDGPVVVLAFGGRIDPSVLAEVTTALPDAVCIGCSTSGEIANDVISDDELSLVLLTFRDTRARLAVAPVSPDVGEVLGRELSASDLAHVFVLSDGLSVNGSALVEGLLRELPPEVVVTGGLAGDGPRFGSTWVWAGGDQLEGHVVALGLYGDALIVDHATGRGWDSFGVERTVTKSDGNVLYELDDQPALELYKTYLGALSDQLPAMGLLFPLALIDRHGEDLVRTILAVDEEVQSLTFAGDVPQGSRVRLMRTNLDRLVDGAADAATAAVPEDAVLALVISCVGRRLVLGDRAEEEIEAVAEALAPGSGLLGFYSYGELSPTPDGTTDLHNQTLTLTLWREKAAP